MELFGEALNQGILVQVEDATLVGAVGEDFDFQLRTVHAGYPLLHELHDNVSARFGGLRRAADDDEARFVGREVQVETHRTLP